VSYLCQFVNGYNEMHWQAAKHLLQYLQGMRDYTILYSRGQMRGPESLIPVGYLDVDWASN
jgi:hypothetical protein